jgi:uncharacterized protein (DUF302 family)
MTKPRRNPFVLVGFLAVVAFSWWATEAALAQESACLPGTKVIATKFGFGELWSRLEQAVQNNKMGIVARASASKGAEARGVTIPGNAVVMVYRNDFAVRMLAASVPAGIEAPLRFYVTENADGTASLTYRVPSAVFAPYKSSDLDNMAKELDGIFARIVEDTVGG